MQAANSQGSQAGAIDRPHPAAILSHPAAHLKPGGPLMQGGQLHEIIIAINGHGLRWHVCNAIAKGIVAELSAKDGKYYSLEGARVMVEGVPTRRLFVLFAKFVLLRPIRRTP